MRVGLSITQCHAGGVVETNIYIYIYIYISMCMYIYIYWVEGPAGSPLRGRTEVGEESVTSRS